MSYQRLSYEELTQLPVGSKIAFRPEGGSVAEMMEKRLYNILDKGEPPEWGISVLELKSYGWYVIEDDTTPEMVGRGPWSPEGLRPEYDNGDWFSLVVEDEVENSDDVAA